MSSRFHLAYPIFSILLIGLTGVASAASAQNLHVEGEIGVGGTSTWGDNDEAKFREYRDLEDGFLQQHYRAMPRTMLRYAIEKFPEPRRQGYLKGSI